MTFPTNLSATIRPNVQGGYTASFSICSEDEETHAVHKYRQSFAEYGEALKWITTKYQELTNG